MRCMADRIRNMLELLLVPRQACGGRSGDLYRRPATPPVPRVSSGSLSLGTRRKP